MALILYAVRDNEIVDTVNVTIASKTITYNQVAREFKDNNQRSGTKFYCYDDFDGTPDPWESVTFLYDSKCRHVKKVQYKIIDEDELPDILKMQVLIGAL